MSSQGDERSCSVGATSLRANGSRECPSDDRLREAIHCHLAYGKVDCFAWLTMTVAPAGAHRSILTPPKIVIKYNYSAQEVKHAHGKRFHRRRGFIRPAQDRAEGRGADRGP